MIVCSACLAGMACKYSGLNNNTDERIVRLVESGDAIPVCPEMLGGLSVPRVSCEMRASKVINREGDDLTDAFELGAKRALAIAKGVNASAAVLMPRSPSCGYQKIYDGYFTGTLIEGNGLFVQKLLEAGIPCFVPNMYFEGEMK